MKRLFKYSWLVLLLTLFSCKREIKSEDTINKSVYKMWDDYTKSNPEFINFEIPESWFFHNNEKDANRLGKLTLTGRKKAGSSLYALYEKYKAPLPKVGVKEIITTFDGKAISIIETIKVDTISFNKISKEYAEMDMGTDIEPLKKWRKAHWDFFEGLMKDEEIGKPTEDMLVLCVWYEKIWPEKN